MTFSEITTNLLAKKNCSLYVKRMEGAFFVQDLHKYVKTDMAIIAKIKDPRKSDRAKMLKEQLIYILENFDKIEKHSLNWKPKNKKR